MLRRPSQSYRKSPRRTAHAGRSRLRYGQHEATALDEVRRDREQALALRQRLAHEAQVEIFEVAQAAMHQLAGGGRRVVREAVLLDEQHGEAAAGRVARDAGAVDSAADDEQVVGQVVHPAVAMAEG